MNGYITLVRNRKMKNLLINTLNKRNQYLYSIVTVVLISAICFGLSEFIGYRVVAFILLLTVSLLAVSFDILPVLFGAALSALIWDIFLSLHNLPFMSIPQRTQYYS